MLVTVVLALALGVVNITLYQAYAVLVFVNPILSALCLGLLYLPFMFVLHVVRRPGAGLLSGLIVGLAAIPFSPAGVLAIVANVLNGLFAELPYTVTRYRRFGGAMPIVDGVVATVIAMLLYYVPPLNFANVALQVQVLTWICALVSGVVCGVFVQLLGAALVRTGILANTALGREQIAEV